MNNKPIRILQVLGSLNRNGAETMVMNLYRAINHNEVQFDFIVHTNLPGHFYEEAKNMGARIFCCPKYNGFNHLLYIKWWKYFFKNHSEYKIIHSHIRSTAAIYLYIAKKYGLKTIIHSHSTTEGSGLKAFAKRALEYPLKFIADYLFACSNEAGQWLFGKDIVSKSNYRIIPNGIDVNLYKFNQSIRDKYRNILKISNNAKVFIHVGRFHPAKNHEFLINIFEKICQFQSDSILLLAGDGELRATIEKHVEKLNLSPKVKFLGNRSDIPNLLQVADCFLFPSKWEGLGIVAIEAQASGLPCICSEYVPKLVSVSNNCKFLPLKEELWLKEVLNTDFTRSYNINAIKKAGFDIKETSNYMTSFYKELSHD